MEIFFFFGSYVHGCLPPSCVFPTGVLVLVDEPECRLHFLRENIWGRSPWHWTCRFRPRLCPGSRSCSRRCSHPHHQHLMRNVHIVRNVRGSQPGVYCWGRENFGVLRPKKSNFGALTTVEEMLQRFLWASCVRRVLRRSRVAIMGLTPDTAPLPVYSSRIRSQERSRTRRVAGERKRRNC